MEDDIGDSEPHSKKTSYNEDMAETLKIIADRQAEPNTLVAAGELIEMRFQDGQKGLSLRASKLMHVLINAPGAEAGKAVEHVIRLARLNEVHHRSKDQLLIDATELVRTTITMGTTSPAGKKATEVGSILSMVSIDADSEGDLRYQISPTMIKVLKKSGHFGLLDALVVNALTSRYSVRLYELMSKRIGLKHVHSETFELDDLRKRFGVPAGKLTTWSNFRMKVLDIGVKEVNHLAGMSIQYEPVKRSRNVVGVKLIWRVKEQAERDTAARELDRSSVGRTARRDGTVEYIVEEPDMVSPEDIQGLIQELSGSLKNKLLS